MREVAQLSPRLWSGRAGGQGVRAVVDGGIAGVLERAGSEGRGVLTDAEGFTLAGALGLAVPVHRFVTGVDEAAALDLSAFPGDRLVVKVADPDILHRTDLGGVVVVPHDRSAVIAAIENIERRLGDRAVAGFTVNEFVLYDDSLGGELLLGFRNTADFGPVVSYGPGGVHAEFLAQHLAPGAGVVVLAPDLTEPEKVRELLAASAVTPLATGEARGGRRRLEGEELAQLVRRFMEFAARPECGAIAEFEISPIALTERGPVALDVLVKLRERGPRAAAERPLDKLPALLAPRSMAILGVSARGNPGRTILENVLREGFPPERLAVVKPGHDTLLGVRCYPDIASLPEPVDLMVLSVAAADAATALEEVIAGRRAEAVLLIPGGLGELHTTQRLEDRVRDALEAARGTEWRGPLVNGGNSLGVRSVPGRLDTMFVPAHKLPARSGPPDPVAIVSQSGAFAAARSSKLARLNPSYLISVLFACYVEGFRPLDGRRWLAAAREITASGRTVLLYRGGRTQAGAAATASHTAVLAGDYEVTRRLAEAAGVVVAESLADFEDFIRLAGLLRGKRVDGWRLGAVSNAGFECVAIADALGRFELASFTDDTRENLGAVLRRSRLDEIVAVANPIDLTPTMGDADYEQVIRTVLDDANVDVGIVGCVPPTGALNTLADDGHGEDVRAAGSVASRMGRLMQAHAKAWVAVVDAGSQYDPMVEVLDGHGVPTFRTADRAVRMLETYCSSRLRPEMSAPRTPDRE